MRAHLQINGIENLEPRFLLTGFASLDAKGKLSIVGDAGANVIDVNSDLDQIVVMREGASLSFDKDDVKNISVEGFDGDDKISINVALPSVLIGDAGNDTLTGNAMDDSLYGGSGDDRIAPGRSDITHYVPHSTTSGRNFIDAGGGNDVIDYSQQGSGTWVPGDDDLELAHKIYPEQLVSIDRFAASSFQAPLTLVLTAGDDDFHFFAKSKWTMLGGAGNDYFAFASESSAHLLDGGSGNDTFSLNSDNLIDSVRCGSGNDAILDMEGRKGTRICDGGSGHDTYTLIPNVQTQLPKTYRVTIPTGFEDFDVTAYYSVVVNGNGSSNVISATGSNVSIYGNGGNDILNVNAIYSNLPDSGHGFADGGSGNDTIRGDRNRNLLKGGDGNDRIDGYGGNDTIYGGDGNDLLLGEDGSDQIHGGGGKDTIWAGTGNDTLWGDSSRDRLFGENGNDTLFAKDGRTDTVDGGNGADKAQRDNSSTIKDSIFHVESFI